MLLVAAPLVAQTTSPSRDIPAFDVNNLHETLAHHPATDLAKIFPDSPAAPSADFKPTGLSKKDYLPLIAGNVDYWKHFLSREGAIVDPFEKKERQYSTPAFALASALLVREAGRADLLEQSARATSFAIAALANKTTADNHADFYIPMLIHARRILKDKVAPDVAAKWDEQLKSLVPETTYRDTGAKGNWNLVNVSGELMRRKDGLVKEDQLAPQQIYLDRCLTTQLTEFTRFGMYEDPNGPLAYDAFPRLWLEDALADGALTRSSFSRVPTGTRSLCSQYEQTLSYGSLSGLLLLSPSGEWACGGRSAQHQWNEAENAEISEINAARWAKRNRADLAGSFKRAAHLALTSMKRWQRPSGELWIVKNFADPARRLGYEGYSFNSQYNLLAVAMLAIAYERADESIAEFPIPSESATYVFDLRDFYHHIVAASGGTYILVDTSADPHYGATGLQRLHQSGVALSPLTDSAAAERAFGPAENRTVGALSPGLQWKIGDAWHALGDFGIHQHQNAPSRKGRPLPPPQKNYMDHVDFTRADHASFTLLYTPAGDGALPIEETYTISAQGVDITTRLASNAKPDVTRFAFPAMINDGARMTDITTVSGKLTIHRVGGTLNCEVLSPSNVNFHASGPALVTHNGYVQAMIADLPAGTTEVEYRITLAP
jgi:hypothetical protein